MATVDKRPHGPIWPLGFIKVVTPGTPVSIMSLVDSAAVNDPNSSNRTGSTYEYAIRAQQIQFEAIKSNTHGMQNNTGNVYLLLRNTGADRDDTGSMFKMLDAGETYILASAPTVRNVYNPYDIYVDADNANDGVLVSLLIF